MIIAAARNMLRNEEAGTLTARSLAKPLSIPASAIYRIFPTMSDVIMAVNQETFAELEALFDALPQDHPPADRLIAISAQYMGFMQDNPNLWRALFTGMRRQQSYPEWYLDAIQSLLKRLANLLREIQPELSEDLAMETAGRLYVTAHGAISLELDGRLEIITSLNGQEIALGAIRNTIIELSR